MLVLANLHPLIFTELDLLEMNYVVASGTVAILIETELVFGQTFEFYLSKVFEEFVTFCGLHGFTETWFAVTQVVVHVSVGKREENLRIIG